MANETGGIVLSMQDLREVSGYAAESAQEVLEIFERAHPADGRPRDAIGTAWAFAWGGKRGKTLRDTAWAALRAAQDADTAAGDVRGVRRVPAPAGRRPPGEAHPGGGGPRGEGGRTCGGGGGGGGGGADSGRLGPRDRALAAGLLALAEGRMDDACATYRRLLARSPRDFAAQYGLGECLSRDPLVVRDPSDPRRWRFRGSLAGGVAAYARALQLVPSYFEAARGHAFAALTGRVLFTGATAFRRGFMLAPDTVWMGAYPELVGDTVTFRPVPVDALFARAAPPSHPAAVAHNREALRALTARWVEAYPRSPLARWHYGEALEALGLLDDSAPATPGALRVTAAARRLGAADPTVGVEDRAEIAGAGVRVLLKLGRYERARAVADSALADTLHVAAPPDAGRGAEALAGLAALTGRARLTARLLARVAAEPGSGVFRGSTGAGAAPPAPVLRAGGAFTAYAALAAPAESLRASHARAERAIDTWVAAGARARTRDLVLGRGGLLAQPALGPAALRGIRRPYDEQVALWQALDRRDTAAVRRGLGARPHRPVRDAPYAPEWLLQRAHLALAVRDTAAARGALDEVLADLPRQSPRLTREVGPAAALGRALVLRARLAPADPAARDAARALWRRADEELRPAGAPPPTGPR